MCVRNLVRNSALRIYRNVHCAEPIRPPRHRASGRTSRGTRPALPHRASLHRSPRPRAVYWPPCLVALSAGRETKRVVLAVGGHHHRPAVAEGRVELERCGLRCMRAACTTRCMPSPSRRAPAVVACRARAASQREPSPPRLATSEPTPPTRVPTPFHKAVVPGVCPAPAPRLPACHGLRRRRRPSSSR